MSFKRLFSLAGITCFLFACQPEPTPQSDGRLLSIDEVRSVLSSSTFTCVLGSGTAFSMKFGADEGASEIPFEFWAPGETSRQTGKFIVGENAITNSRDGKLREFYLGGDGSLTIKTPGEEGARCSKS